MALCFELLRNSKLPGQNGVAMQCEATGQISTSRLYRKRRSDQPEDQSSQREQRNSEQFARPLETPASAGGNSIARSISSRLRVSGQF